MSEEYFAKQQYPAEPESKRPAILTILCLFSLIGGGMSILSNLIFTLFYDMMVFGFKQLEKTGMVFPGMDIITTQPRLYFLINIFLSAGSFYGALEMWRMKKTGFHFYTASQLGMLIMTMVYLGLSFSSGTTYFTIAFIILYAMNLKYMVR